MSQLSLGCSFHFKRLASSFRNTVYYHSGNFCKTELCLPYFLTNLDVCRHKSTKRGGNGSKLSNLVMPVPIRATSNPDDINIGEEMSCKLAKDDILKLLNQFSKRPAVNRLSEENGLDNKLFQQAFHSFRNFCIEAEALPIDLHIVFSDLLQGAGHVDDLFPFFLQHARQVFPHLNCMEELQKISDLRLPANWYPKARAINRKIIFHAGPTNSGKTFHALERYTNAKTGIYCGPLKLLATEVYNKTNSKGTMCDLITGEEQKYTKEDGNPSNHLACTVEMTSVNTPYEVAVIDEIQMIRDIGRGWAWTRALLGVPAEEVHLCGEEAALEIVKELVTSVGEEVEVRRYKRLTDLTIEDEALGSLDKIQPGDCIVCFSKNDIYSVSLQLEKQGIECAVIYGGLPPGTKIAQSQKFNDPNHSCKVLVATDAIGMGLNLSIRRIIFMSLTKFTINEKGEKEITTLSTSQALQIAGRAGRFGTQFDHGFVTTFKNEDLNALKTILSRTVDPIEAAGLHPTADQIELFAYHLPDATLSNLIDVFVSICRMDSSNYFMCNIDDFKFLADMIQHVPLPLRARYVFCCAPIIRKFPFVCSMFLRIARQYSRNQPITFNWLCQNIGWPFSPPKTIMDLVHLECVFDILDLYLWLSYRFLDLFPETQLVKEMQQELDATILMGVFNITTLVKNTENKVSSAMTKVDEDDFLMKNKKDAYNVQQHEHMRHTKSKLGTLSQRLLDQGLITPNMLKQLKDELINDENTTVKKKPK